MKAVWVKVYWSESNEFKDDELVPFKEFEKRCRKIARQTGCNSGYTKTKTLVLFDEGSQYELRLDLAENDDHGFKDRAIKTIAYHERNASSPMGSYVEFLKKIQWD